MKQRIVLIVIILVILSISIGVSYSYFSANIIKKDINGVDVSSGKVDIKIDDNSINAKNISPIYDEDYK